MKLSLLRKNMTKHRTRSSDGERLPECPMIRLTEYTHAKVNRVKAGDRRLESGTQPLHDVQRLTGEIRAGGQPRSLSQLQGKAESRH